MTQPTTPKATTNPSAWIHWNLKMPRLSTLFQRLFSGPAWTWSTSALVASSLSHSSNTGLYQLALSNMASGHYLLAHLLLFVMIGISTFGWLQEKLRCSASLDGWLPETMRRVIVATALLGWASWHWFLAYAG